MIALVTGASRGIGAAIARELANKGDSLILAARSAAELESVAAEISDGHEDVVVEAVTCDVTNESDVVNLLAGVGERHGGLDVLVNCAGMAIPATSVQELSLEIWQQIFDANMSSAFLMTRESIPLLKRSKERPTIVNIASTAGTSARPGWSAYAASKAALVNFSNTMGEELKPDRIRVHCVAPGRTATELRRTLAPDEDPSTIMQPEAVAELVRFLVSEAAGVIQGQTILVRQ